MKYGKGIECFRKETDLDKVLANPLSVISSDKQILKENLKKGVEEPGSAGFINLISELQVKNAQQQRILTKFTLLANADTTAKNVGIPTNIPTLPNTWLFEGAWERLKWSGISLHTVEANSDLLRRAESL